MWKEFWKAYKRNFKQATICWLIMAVVAILLFVDFRIIRVFQGSMYSVMRVILAIILGMWILMFQYLFPYIARFEMVFCDIAQCITSCSSEHSVYNRDYRFKRRITDSDIIYIQIICSCKYFMGVLRICSIIVCTVISAVPDF